MPISAKTPCRQGPTPLRCSADVESAQPSEPMTSAAWAAKKKREVRIRCSCQGQALLSLTVFGTVGNRVTPQKSGVTRTA
jgi:hypothetical protein